MEVVGKKETTQSDGTVIQTDVTLWALLGLVVDNLFKTWARHGGPAMLACEIYQRQKVKVCRVIVKGTQRWPSPGAEKNPVPEAPWLLL